jgi:uncharacterized protein
MIALDTNILVYGHRKDSPFHRKAYALIKELAEAKASWAIVTHNKIFNPPTSPISAIEQMEAWLESPSLHLIGESSGYFEILKQKLLAGKLHGPKVHDARIASICIQNGIRLLYSSDRDYNKISGLKIENPLIEE